jgi:hypothetical protein
MSRILRLAPTPGSTERRSRVDADGVAMVEDWKQAWKGEVVRAERAEARVAKLEAGLRWAAQTVHQAHHLRGSWEDCPKPACMAVRATLADGPRRFVGVDPGGGTWPS